MVSTYGLLVASLALLLASALAADCSRLSGGSFRGTAITSMGGAILRFSEVCVCVCACVCALWTYSEQSLDETDAATVGSSIFLSGVLH